MAEPSLSRGKFLRSLGSTVTGLALGTGVAVAAKVLAKASGLSTTGTTFTPAAPETTHKDTTHFFESGSSQGNRIALTFDDGPTPGVTDRILDQLKERNITATFFMIGEKVAAAPELARRVLAEGHEIGNHTFTHPKLTTLSDQQVIEEIRKTQDILGEVLKQKPVWFRPPYGALRKNQSGLLQKENLGVVLWSIDSRDWSQPGEAKITEVILAQAHPGAIILCHDLHLQTAHALETILDGLLELHYTFSTISILLDRHNSLHLAISSLPESSSSIL